MQIKILVATVSTITFHFDKAGFDKAATRIRRVGDVKTKSKEIKKLLRRQAKPLVPALRNEAPEATKTVTYHRDKSIKYPPGNLKKSIRIFNGKSKQFPTVYVGPQAKKPKGSGYYSYFIQYGTKGRNGIFRKNNYVERVYRSSREQVGTQTSRQLAKYLEKEFRKQGFQTV